MLLAPLILAVRANLDRKALDAAFAASKLAAPSVSAAVLKDGKTMWEARKNASPDAPFRIGSLTKAFTATVVLQLVNEGRLSLDDLAANFVPELPGPWRGVTIRQLLHHTSGIPDYTEQPDFEARMSERLTPDAIVARTADKPLNFPSGTQFRYANSGYVILGMIVEKLDGRPFADSLQRRVLRPLGLRHTRLNVDGDRAEVLGFTANGKPARAINMTQPYAAGSVVSTIGDMERWVAAQGSTRLLPAKLWAEMERSGTLSDGTPTHYGMGWIMGSMNGVRTIEHGGGIPGFITWIARVPSKGLASIVLANSDVVNSAGLARELLQSADPTLKGPIVFHVGPAPKEKPDAPKTAPTRQP